MIILWKNEFDTSRIDGESVARPIGPGARSLKAPCIQVVIKNGVCQLMNCNTQ